MQRIELRIEKRDVPIIALSAAIGLVLVLFAFGADDMAAAVFVGVVAGAPSGAGGGVLVCIFRRYMERKE